MTRKLFILSLMLVCGQTFSQSQLPLKKSLARQASILVGEIDKHSPVTLNLELTGDSISGFLYKGNESMVRSELRGKHEGNELKFYELRQSENGQFDTVGRFVLNAKKFSGQWSEKGETYAAKFRPSSDGFTGYVISKSEYKDLFKYTDNQGQAMGVNMDFEFEQFTLHGSASGIKSINDSLYREYSNAVNHGSGIFSDMVNEIEQYKSYGFGIGDGLVYSVDYFDRNIIAISSSGYLFMGGAHGVEHQSSTIYDLHSGKVITLDDILMNKEDTQLLQLLQKKIFEYFGVTTKEEIDANLFVKLEELRLSSTYTISEKALTFTYHPYEIAAYAAGMPSVSFTLGELKPFLKTDSPVGYLFEGIQAVEATQPPIVVITESTTNSPIMFEGGVESVTILNKSQFDELYGEVDFTEKLELRPQDHNSSAESVVIKHPKGDITLENKHEVYENGESWTQVKYLGYSQKLKAYIIEKDGGFFAISAANPNVVYFFNGRFSINSSSGYTTGGEAESDGIIFDKIIGGKNARFGTVYGVLTKPLKWISDNQIVLQEWTDDNPRYFLVTLSSNATPLDTFDAFDLEFINMWGSGSY